MRFEDLPNDIQVVAANTLRDALLNCDIKTEPAKELARDIGTAFAELFNCSAPSPSQPRND